MHGTRTSRAIKAALERKGLKQSDIAAIVGGKNRASEICNGKRAVRRKSLAALSKLLDLPIEKLLDEPKP